MATHTYTITIDNMPEDAPDVNHYVHTHIARAIAHIIQELDPTYSGMDIGAIKWMMHTHALEVSPDCACWSGDALDCYVNAHHTVLSTGEGLDYDPIDIEPE